MALANYPKLVFYPYAGMGGQMMSRWQLRGGVYYCTGGSINPAADPLPSGTVTAVSFPSSGDWGGYPYYQTYPDNSTLTTWQDTETYRHEFLARGTDNTTSRLYPALRHGVSGTLQSNTIFALERHGGAQTAWLRSLSMGTSYEGSNPSLYDFFAIGVYQHNNDCTYVFAPRQWTNGTWPVWGFARDLSILSYRKWNGTALETEVVIPTFTGDSYMSVLPAKATFIRPEEDGDYFYMVYFSAGYNNFADPPIAPHIGVLVMNAVTNAVVSNHLYPVQFATTWLDTISRVGNTLGNRLPPHDLAPYATLSNGTRLAQFMLNGVCVKVTWTAGTASAPTVLLKDTLNATSGRLGGLVADTLEINGDQVYHVLYRYRSLYYSNLALYGHELYACCDDATSNTVASSWAVLNDDKPIMTYFINSSNTTYKSWNSASGVTGKSFVWGSFGPAWQAATWIDWWTTRTCNIGVTCDLGLSVAVVPVPVGPPKVDIYLAPSNFVAITTTVTKSVYVDLYYDCADTDVVSYMPVTVDIGLTMSVSFSGVFRWYMPVTVDIGLTATVSVKMIRIVHEQSITNLHWSVGYSDAFIDCINVDRQALGLNLYQHMTPARLLGSEDVSQTHADNMAAVPLFASEDASFPAGYQTWVDRRSHSMNASGYGLITLKRLLADFNLNGDLHTTTRRTIVNDYTVPTPQELYDAWKVTASSYFEGTHAGHTELYGLLGVNIGPYTGYPNDTHALWFDFELYDYEGIMGGGGGGGVTQPTPDTNELGLMLTSPHYGITWLEEFLVLANEKRAYFGLPPYLLPTLTTYTNHLDSAQLHSEDMAATRIFQHDDAGFPVGRETAAQRHVIAGSRDGVGGENILLYFAGINAYTPANPSARSGVILNDYTFPTPKQAFDAWWYSPGHRANIIRDWGTRDMFAYMGMAYGLVPPSYGMPSDYQGWYLTNVFLDLAEVQMEVLLNVNSTFNGALIELLTGQWDVTAYTPVTAAHEATYSTRVAATHSLSYGCRVAVQHEAPLQYSVAMDNQADYSASLPLSLAHEVQYRLWNNVPVAQPHSVPYDGGDYVTVAMESPYSLMGQPQAAHVAPYSASYTVQKGHGMEWDIKSTNVARQESKAFWSLMEGTATLVASAASVTVNGRTVPVADAVVSQSEDNVAWEARIRLADINDYVGINDYDVMVLDLGGEEYTMIVTGKTIDRSGPAKVDVQMSAKSDCVLLDAPFAEQISYTNDLAPVSCRTAVETILGRAITTWNAPDWMLPMHRIAFEDVTPLEAARTLLGAMGAILQAEKNGNLTVRLLYPVAAHRFATASVDHTFTDAEDTLSVSEDHEVREEYNLFRISEGETAFADRLEYEADLIPDGGRDEKGDPTGTLSPTAGKVYVYPSPIRSTFRLINTQAPLTSNLVYIGQEWKEYEEMVEFVEGQAGLSHPIDSLTTIKWWSTPLGGLSYTPGSSVLNASSATNYGRALATVTYNSWVYTYHITGVGDTHALILMEDTGA